MNAVLENRSSDGGRQSSPGLDLHDLYLENADFVWRSALRLGIQRQDAGDFVQDAFALAFTRAHTFDPTLGSVRAWLYGICRNHALNEKRKKRTRARIWQRYRNSEPPPKPITSPEIKIGSLELAERAHHILMTIPEDQRSVFVLVDLEDLTIDDAARVLKVGNNTAWSRLRAARKKIAKANVPPRETTQQQENSEDSERPFRGTSKGYVVGSALASGVFQHPDGSVGAVVKEEGSR